MTDELTPEHIETHPHHVAYNEGDSLVLDFTEAGALLREDAPQFVSFTPEPLEPTFEVVATDNDGMPVWA